MDDQGFSLRPFVYGTATQRDLATMSRTFIDDTSKRYYLQFFVSGDTYVFLGLFETDMHLFGVDQGGTLYLMGTDDLGRDVFSRILYGGAISLSVGLVGVILSFVLGTILGGISGYYGGAIDTLIQRLVGVPDLDPDDPPLDGPQRGRADRLGSRQDLLRDHADPGAHKLAGARANRAQQAA